MQFVLGIMQLFLCFTKRLLHIEAFFNKYLHSNTYNKHAHVQKQPTIDHE